MSITLSHLHISLIAILITICGAYSQTVTTTEEFYAQVAAYAAASGSVEIVVKEDIVLDKLITLSAMTGKTLTIRSANPAAPVVLKRGIIGNLFTINYNALILKDIIIDGDKGSFENGSLLVMINNGASFTMNEGAVLRNNASSGVAVSGGIFIMNGGSISGNTAVNTSGGVVVYGGTFTMNGGEISENTAAVSATSGSSSGGVYVSNGTFTMNGGEISENTAAVYAIWGSSVGGVYIKSNSSNNSDIIFTLGTTTVITGNTIQGAASNVFLDNNQYIVLETPLEGMHIGITKSSNNGVFVRSGAIANYAQYFHDDVSGRAINYFNGALALGDSPFHRQVEVYATASDNVEIVIDNDFILDQLVSIPTPATEGITLTIHSANPEEPAVLKRGAIGNLFTIHSGATLILKNIIIDGDKNGDFANGGGSLVLLNIDGTFIMNNGAILCNNVFVGGGGGGVYMNAGTFIMNGGEIRENATQSIRIRDSANKVISSFMSFGGGVYVNYGVFTMNNGSIAENAAVSANDDGTIQFYYGGNVYVSYGAFTMNGGGISGNSAKSATAGNRYEYHDPSVYIDSRFGATRTIAGGIVVETGVFYEATYAYAPVEGLSGGVAVAYNKPTGNGPFVYSNGSSTHLTVYPTEEATVVWAINDDGKFGLSYKNGDNEGFFEVSGVKVIAEGDVEATVATADEFYEQIAVYATIEGNIIINVSQDITISSLVSVPTPVTAGITLTIRSANPEEPVVLKRGAVGNLFTVHSEATLILEDIIIDGDRYGNFEDGGGSLVFSNMATFVMNDGVIAKNNVSAISGTTVTEGNISGIYIYGGTFNMNGGEISGNEALGYFGGGNLNVYAARFNMADGLVVGSNAISGVFNMTGGVLAGFNYYQLNNLNNGDSPASNNGIIITTAWNEYNEYTYIFAEGTSAYLTIRPNENATAVWAIKDGKFGVSYKNGNNEGFVEFTGLTVKTVEELDIEEKSCNAENKLWIDNFCRPKEQHECHYITEIWDNDHCRVKTVDDCTETEMFENGYCRIKMPFDCAENKKYDYNISNCRAKIADDCLITELFEHGDCRPKTSNDCLEAEIFENGNCSTSIRYSLITAQQSLATPIYYTIKGVPLGSQKPNTPGVYIEKRVYGSRKIVVK